MAVRPGNTVNTLCGTIQVTFNSVVVTKLTYAASSWLGIVPDRLDYKYNFRPRHHSFVLTAKTLYITHKDLQE